MKLVNKYFGFNNKEDIKFSDIHTNDWYYNDICIASKSGYINGNDGKKLIDNKSGNTYGMIYRNIVKEVKTGAPKITNKVTPNGDVGSTVLGLQTLDTGKSIWENYFKSINSKS